MHNLMRERYPNLQNADMDIEKEDGEIIPGAWRDNAMLAELETIACSDNMEGKALRIQLKYYYNSPAGSVPWQELAVNK